MSNIRDIIAAAAKAGVSIPYEMTPEQLARQREHFSKIQAAIDQGRSKLVAPPPIQLTPQEYAAKQRAALREFLAHGNH